MVGKIFVFQGSIEKGLGFAEVFNSEFLGFGGGQNLAISAKALQKHLLPTYYQLD